MPETLNVLYLCTGNSCRSQIAEGWTRLIGNGWVEVQSAGIEAHGKNPRAIAVMQEEIMDQFRATCEEIESRVRDLLDKLSEGVE